MGKSGGAPRSVAERKASGPRTKSTSSLRDRAAALAELDAKAKRAGALLATVSRYEDRIQSNQAQLRRLGETTSLPPREALPARRESAQQTLARVTRDEAALKQWAESHHALLTEHPLDSQGDTKKGLTARAKLLSAMIGARRDQLEEERAAAQDSRPVSVARPPASRSNRAAPRPFPGRIAGMSEGEKLKTLRGFKGRQVSVVVNPMQPSEGGFTITGKLSRLDNLNGRWYATITPKDGPEQLGPIRLFNQLNAPPKTPRGARAKKAG